jgi:hypothetical protein
MSYAICHILFYAIDDHKLIETLATSKVKSQEISLKVQEAEITEKQIDESRNMYRPVAYRGSILYFCIADLGTIDPMYQVHTYIQYICLLILLSYYFYVF